jgi:hypothetical protein
MPVRDINKVTHSQVYDLPKDYGYGPGDFVAQWEVRLWRPGGASTQPANFSITGEIKRRGYREPQACGRLDDDLREFAKLGRLQGKDVILPELLKWQGFHVDRGPWYYVENGLYWLHRHLRHAGRLPEAVESYLRSTRDYEKAEDAKGLDHFKSTIAFGALDDDAIPELPELPRAPDASDAHIYELKEIERRHHAWVRRCEAIVDDVIVPWLNGRLPRLMALFEADMVRWFGPEILTAPDGKEPSP